MFSEFAAMLKRDERVTLQMTAGKDGQLRVAVYSELSGDGEGLSEEATNLRAALTAPLVVTDTPEALDAEAPALIRRFQESREGVAQELEVMSQLKEAKKLGRASNEATRPAGDGAASQSGEAASAGAASGRASSDGGETPPPEPAASEPASNPGSLL